MVYTGQMIRFFISSTFHDMHPERNALQEQVFPELRQFCREKGARFQAIDLRWGVSQEASQDQRTLAICLEEIRRCREVSPRFNFLVLLGDRHGSDLLPEQIAEDEFKKLLAAMNDSERVTVTSWYQLDHNAIPPVYVLRPKTVAYPLLRVGFCRAVFQAQSCTSKCCTLRERYTTPKTKQYRDYKTWEPVQQKLHTILAEASKRAQFDETAQVKYVASATEIEIVEGIFKYTVEEQQPLCFFRTINGAPRDGSVPLYVESNSEKYDRLVALKQRLKERYAPDLVYEYTAQWDEASKDCSKEHLESFCKEVAARLKVRINAILGQPGQDKKADIEMEAFQQFVKERTRNFVGRDEAVATIATYLNSRTPYPLVVSGDSGSGKSTLLAHAAQITRNKQTSAVVEEVYIGVTPDSSNTRTLLTNLWDRVMRIYGSNATTIDGEVLSIPTDERDLIEKLPNLLHLANANRPLLLFIDALDQLREGSQRNWIPRTLPPHVRMVVSALPGTELNVLKQDLPASQVLPLKKMTREQGNALLSLWLEKEAQRTLQPAQRAAVLDKFVMNGLPLYLRLAFEETRRWPSYQEAPNLKSDVKGILQDLFERLAHDVHHGKALVGHGLGYLGAARNGLSEDEMLDLLARNEEVLTDIKRLSPDSPVIEPKLPFPVVLWSRVFFDLNPYLTERSVDGTNLIGFYHRQLDEVVKSMYLQGNEKLARHRALAEYFKGQSVVNGAVPNLRKLAEQPFQQTEGEQWDDLYETLTNFKFLEQKVATGEQEHMNLAQVMTKTYSGIYDLQRDFERAINSWPSAS